ncbi:zwei Ig domain protein zig-8-like [Portunus trituberculatus]|uniref:zwei Ig domain protein zig-8-like n=1 Tax=Portunus trituberculatus TaxID=210409 RepID=UPI001E1CCE9B|nr:zwei Ig domain protein zig-8-like [Portunus trituberculatus]
MPSRTRHLTVLSQAASIVLLAAAGGAGLLMEGGEQDNATEGAARDPHALASVTASIPESIEAHKTSFPGRVSATATYIDPVTPHRVYAYAGTTAFIPCVVNNLGQRSVSWVRHHDIHVLTVGRFTFTNDDRFEVHHDDGSNEWLLRLRSPSANDTGIYECQINTKPTITQLIRLEVLEPRAVITAGQELYLDRGSTLRLTCQVLDAPSSSDFLLWYHEQKVANYEVDKVEVSVRVDNDTTVSSLTLRDAQVHNSGQYTCSPSNAKPASIRVHVLSGEHPAAMQTNAAPVLLSFSPSSYLSWKRMMPTMLLPLLSLCLSLQHLPLSLHNTS